MGHIEPAHGQGPPPQRSGRPGWQKALIVIGWIVGTFVVLVVVLGGFLALTCRMGR